MPETDKKAPRVINKSGTLKMEDKVAATKVTRDISGKKMDRKNRRDRVKADVLPKEYDEITIDIHTEKENKHVDEVCLASMAMASLLLAKYDEEKYGTNSEIWKACRKNGCVQ